MASPKEHPLLLRVDPSSKTPAYRQIAAQLRALANGGALTVGGRLPTVRSLASRARVHFNTVARAYRALDREGILSTERGRGTFVRRRRPAGQRHALDALSRDYVASAARLGFAPDELRRALDRALATAGSAGKNKGGN